MSTATQTVRDSFNFNIEKFPLSGPDGMQTPWYGLFRSDNGEVVGEGSVTSRYVPHQTDDVIALVEAAESVFDESVSVRTHFRDGHFVTLEPSRDYRKAIFGTSDNIFPRLFIRGCFDRKAFSASLGYYRDICKNLSIMRSVTETTQNIRHTSGLRSKMNELIGQFQTLKESWQTLGSLVERMQNVNVNLAEFLNSVYGEPEQEDGRGVTIHRNRTEKIFQRLSSERLRSGRPQLGSDWMVSAWEAYNAVQGFVQHDSTRRNGTSEYDRVVLALNSEPVRVAERLAVEAVSAA
jgi:DNA-binding transcriptional regulator GbsR (MarR family)